MAYVVHAVRPVAAKAMPVVFVNKPGRQPQAWVLLKMIEQLLDVRRLNRQIGIDIPDKVVCNAFKQTCSFMQRDDLRVKTVAGSLAYTQKPNEVVPIRIALDNFVGPVGRI